ncbi:MAG: extracellular solute-binding protein, partial [Anaerolineae bacterium]
MDAGRVRPAALVAPQLLAALSLTFAASGCSGSSEAPTADREVVVYASVDQNYAEPVLEAFEAETGIRVRPVYDVEAAKTTGLVNRLMAESDAPIADVWWSGEFAQTVELADSGVLAPYAAPASDDIPAGFVSPEALWTGFGGRARVLLVNTDLLDPSEYPESIFDLVDGDIAPEQVGIAHPVFGTTAAQAAALYAALGDEAAREYFESLRDAGVKVLDGNAAVRDQVANRRLAVGLTDTDDACVAIRRGDPVAMVFPDQGEGGLGTLIVPNTVALVAGGPNEAEGRELIDFLLGEDTARGLVEAGWFQMTLRPIEGAESCVDTSGVRAMFVSLPEIAA